MEEAGDRQREMNWSPRLAGPAVQDPEETRTGDRRKERREERWRDEGRGEMKEAGDRQREMDWSFMLAGPAAQDPEGTMRRCRKRPGRGRGREEMREMRR